MAYSATHVRVVPAETLGSLLVCERCGEEELLPPDLTVQRATDYLSSFEFDHEDCPEDDEEEKEDEENDQPSDADLRARVEDGMRNAVELANQMLRRHASPVKQREARRGGGE